MYCSEGKVTVNVSMMQEKGRKNGKIVYIDHQMFGSSGKMS